MTVARIVRGGWQDAKKFGHCGDAAFHCLAVFRDGNSFAAGDGTGLMHFLDIIWDEADKTAWLLRFEGPTTSPPPADISTVAHEFHATAAQLADARFLETHRGRHLFALVDGRIYLDGLIAVCSLDHARATLDHLAQHPMDS